MMNTTVMAPPTIALVSNWGWFVISGRRIPVLLWSWVPVIIWSTVVTWDIVMIVTVLLCASVLMVGWAVIMSLRYFGHSGSLKEAIRTAQVLAGHGEQLWWQHQMMLSTVQCSKWPPLLWLELCHELWPWKSLDSVSLESTGILPLLHFQSPTHSVDSVH